MEDIVVGLIFVAAAILSSIAKNKKTAKNTEAYKSMRERHEKDVRANDAVLRMEEVKQEAKARPAAPAKPTYTAAPKPVPAATPKPVPAAAVKKKEELHRHEGRQDVPCPKDEPRPSQRREEKPAAPAVPGLKLSFDRNSVVQGFVMSEILNRPRPGMRR